MKEAPFFLGRHWAIIMLPSLTVSGASSGPSAGRHWPQGLGMMVSQLGGPGTLHGASTEEAFAGQGPNPGTLLSANPPGV